MNQVKCNHYMYCHNESCEHSKIHEENEVCNQSCDYYEYVTCAPQITVAQYLEWQEQAFHYVLSGISPSKAYLNEFQTSMAQFIAQKINEYICK